MSVNPRRPLLAFVNAFDPKAATVIYAAGLVVWFAVTLILGLKAGEDELSYAVLEAFSTAWQTAFLWSVAAVALLSMLDCVTRKKSPVAILAHATVFASPFALFLLGTWALDAFYQDHPATLEMTNLFGPFLMVFYLLGIVYMGVRIPGGREAALPAFTLSTTTAVLLVLAFTGGKLFSSTEYIYRDDFGLVLESVDQQGDTVRIQGVVSINKPGPYAFSAIRNDFLWNLAEPPSDLEIVWPQSKKTPVGTGEHPFTITYASRKPKPLPAPGGNLDEDSPAGFESRPDLYLHVSLAGRDGKPDAFIKTIPLWLHDAQLFPASGPAPSPR